MKMLRFTRLSTGLSRFLAAGSIPFTLAALTLVLAPGAALAEDELPLKASLAVNFTASPTSSGVFAIVANGIGNMAHVGNILFNLHKSINFNDGTMLGTFVITAENGDTISGTYKGVIDAPDTKGFTTFGGQLTFTSGTGGFQAAKGTAAFAGLANLGTGQAVYSLQGSVSAPRSRDR